MSKKDPDKKDVHLLTHLNAWKAGYSAAVWAGMDLSRATEALWVMWASGQIETSAVNTMAKRIKGGFLIDYPPRPDGPKSK